MVRNFESLLDALADKAGSDRKAAPLIGVSQVAISAWRTRRALPGDEKSRKIAEVLNLDPRYVCALVHAERAKSPETRSMWQSVAQAFATVLIAVGTVGGLGSPGTAQARLDISPIGAPTGGQQGPQGGERASGGGSEYTLRRKRRRQATAGALLHATARALGLTGPGASVA